MKRIPLTPYSGTLVICTKEEFIRRYVKRWGTDPEVDGSHGATCMHRGPKGQPEYWVFYKGVATLVHEIGHVVLQIFESIKSDPREGNGEPFCYLLDHLVGQALKK